jgi:hypothetical protein
LEHQTDRYVGISAIVRKSRATFSTRRRPSRWAVPFVLVLSSMLSPADRLTLVFSQVIGDEAELERLRFKAEDAMANEDADGAAMAMGRAALMALHLAKRHTDGVRGRIFQGAEHLFRSQEHGYRALALFRRAGEQLPASSGVCGSLRLAHTEAEHSLQTLTAVLSAGDADPQVVRQANDFRQAAETWITVLGSMHTDFQCV